VSNPERLNNGNSLVYRPLAIGSHAQRQSMPLSKSVDDTYKQTFQCAARPSEWVGS